jgi:lysophospholipase L1-like esterase
MLRFVRTAIAITALAAPACVVKLSDRNSPLPNGGVTGPHADCSQVTPVPGSSVGTGPAEPRLVGRFVVDPAAKTAKFDWSGNYISARFEGTTVSVGLEPVSPGKSSKGDDFPPKPMIFTAVVDDRPLVKFTVEPSGEGGKAYLIADDLDPDEPHEVTVHRESEPIAGPVVFHGFDFGDGEALPPTERPRRIEIIGDSITCGYGDEGANATCPFDIPDPENPNERLPVSENQYLAYGSLAARELDADVVTLCFSGKGVYQNYREFGRGEGIQNQDEKVDPQDQQILDAQTTMTLENPSNGRPAYYLRTLANDVAPWDFTKEPEPQVVVINLGTNDFSRDLNQDSIADGIDLVKFHDTYKEFVSFVRSVRPDAHIFLALPPMVTDKFPLDNARSDFRAVLNQIVSELNAAGDIQVYYIELVEMGSRYGLGCDYHPNLEVHRIMADQLAGAIRTKTCW